MKKLILLTTTALLTVNVQAQLTLEHTYTADYIQPFNLEDEGLKWCATDAANKQVRIYNEDHSLWKTVPVDLPAGVNSFSVQYLSTKMFDSDGDIEFIQLYSQLSGSTIIRTSKFYDHNGNIWQGLTGFITFGAVKGNTGWKLLAYGENSYSVYSLPGQFLGVTKQNSSGSSTLSPNPMQEAATLSYTLPADAKTGVLSVFNSNGQQVRVYTVTSDFNNIQMERGDLPAGVYTYKIAAPGYAPSAERFVIQ